MGRFLEGWWNDYARSLRRRRRTERTIGAYRRSFEDFWQFQLVQGLDDVQWLIVIGVVHNSITYVEQPIKVHEPSVGNLVDREAVLQSLEDLAMARGASSPFGARSAPPLRASCTGRCTRPTCICTGRAAVHRRPPGRRGLRLDFS